MGKQLKSAGKSSTSAVANRRLQVWQYSNRGPSYEDNQELAQYLLPKLQHWVAFPVEPANTSYGHYFPLEVDLVLPVTKPRFSDLFKSRSEQPQQNAVGDLVQLFNSTLPREIKRFFRRKRQEPHHLVLFPVADGLSEAERQRHTHVWILKSLEVKCYTSTEKSPVAPKDVPAEMCKLVTSLFSSAIVGAEVAQFASELVNNWTWGRSNLDTYQKLKERFEMAEKKTEIMTHEDQQKVEDKIKDGWTTTERCMDVFIATTESMSELVNDISSGKTISPQHLYEAMISTRNASILLSEYQERALALSKLMIVPREGENDRSKRRINTGIILVGVAAIALAYFTGGLSLIIGGSVVGSAAVGIGGNELFHHRDLSKHKDTIKDFNTTIEELDKALGDANLALTAKFCSQVLKMPLDADNMTPARRNKILATLGVDPQAMRDAKYSEQLVNDRVRRFCDVFKKFETEKSALKKETGFTDLRKREGKLIDIS